MLADQVRTSIRMSKYDLEKILKNFPDKHTFEIHETAGMEMTYVCDDIMHSGVHFNLGSVEHINELTKHSVSDLGSLIHQLHMLGVKMPYPRISLSMVQDIRLTIDSTIQTLNKKTGIAPEKINQILNPSSASKVYLCEIYESITDDLVFGLLWFNKSDPEEMESWGYEPFCTLISLYGDFKYRSLPDPDLFKKKGLNFINYYRNQIISQDTNTVCLPVSKRALEDEISYEVPYLSGHSMVQMDLFRFLFLMNVKGIEVKNNTPNQKINKKRKKNNKFPLLSYKTLVVDTMIVGQNLNGFNNENGNHNRSHTCRGHIKIYTPDKPLFGHTTGPVWVRPHLRGKGPGTIIKDYQIK